MRNYDFCLVFVATFDRLANRYAEKYFHLDLYDLYLERFVKRSGRRVPVTERL